MFYYFEHRYAGHTGTGEDLLGLARVGQLHVQVEVDHGGLVRRVLRYGPHDVSVHIERLVIHLAAVDLLGHRVPLAHGDRQVTVGEVRAVTPDAARGIELVTAFLIVHEPSHKDLLRMEVIYKARQRHLVVSSVF